MGPVESLRDLLGNAKPKIHTLQLSARFDWEIERWIVVMRFYHLEHSHAANVSAEVAQVLGSEYLRERAAIRAKARFAGSVGRVFVGRLGLALYGSKEAIKWEQMD